MPNILTWESGEKVVREALPDEIPPAFDLDAYADRIRDELLEGDKKTKALAMVIADLAVAAGVAPDVPTARELVKTRFRTYFRQLLG